MISLPPSVRIFLCLVPADMRKSFDSLAQMVRSHLGGDPLSGHLFVFRSKRGDRLKLLYWDRDGLAIWYKRLEEGVFRFPAVAAPAPSATGAAAAAPGVEMRAADFMMLLDGVDWQKVARGKRYERPASAACVQPA